jgi:hypothetical protein
VTCNKTVNVTGSQSGDIGGTPFYGTVSGFRALQPNTTLLTTTSPGCDGSRFSSFSIAMGATPGTNTSGAAINMHPGHGMMFDNVSIMFACIGMEVNGNQPVMNRLLIEQVAGAGCIGMRIGNQTTDATTVDAKVLNSAIQSVLSTAGTPGGWGMVIQDCGGCNFDGNDILFFNVGTLVKPGLNQQVIWENWVNTVLGDTTVASPAIIDTADASAKIHGLYFNQAWVASYLSTTPNAHGIIIQDTANTGNVVGIHFVQLRDQAVSGSGILIAGGSEISLDNSVLCGMGVAANGSPPGPYSGVEIGTGVHDVAIRNNRINGFTCDSAINGTTAYSVKFDGGNYNIILTGNNLNGYATAPVGGAPINGVPVGADTKTNIIANNLALDGQSPSVTAAATIEPGAYAAINLSGTTAITTINSCWSGRQLIAIPTTTGVNFATGGNVANTLAATINAPVMLAAYGNSPCLWYAK